MAPKEDVRLKVGFVVVGLINGPSTRLSVAVTVSVFCTAFASICLPCYSLGLSGSTLIFDPSATESRTLRTFGVAFFPNIFQMLVVRLNSAGQPPT